MNDRLSLLPSPIASWVLSEQPITLKLLPQPTIFWALSDKQITLKNECKEFERSQLTIEFGGG
jgi:hypothetical protein